MALGDPFVSVSIELQRHYAEAKAAQWRPDDMAWDACAVTLEPGVRPEVAMAHRVRWTGVFMQISEALLSACGRLAAGWDHMDARLVLAVQAHDYARHLEVWRRYLDRLGTVAPVVRPVQRCLDGLRESDAPGPSLALTVRVYVAALAALYATLELGDVCELRRRLVAPLRADTARHLRAGAALLSVLPDKERRDALSETAAAAGVLWDAVESGLAPAQSGLWPPAELVRQAAARAQQRAA